MCKTNNEEKKFVSLVSDTTFKYLWKNNKTKGWLSDIVKAKSGIDLNQFEITDNELNSGSMLKDYRCDLVFTNDTDNVIIEMNRNYSISSENKARRYLYRKAGNSFDSGENYNKSKKTTLIMFNNYCNPTNSGIKNFSSWLCNPELNIKYDDIEICNIYLPNFKEMCYDKSSDIDKRLWLFGAESFEEMRENIKNDSNLYIVEELERLGMNNKFVDEYDAELVNKTLMESLRDEGFNDGIKQGTQQGIQQGKKEGIEQGKKEGIEQGKKAEKIKIAKNAFKENVDIGIISKITGLSIEELEELKNS